MMVKKSGNETGLPALAFDVGNTFIKWGVVEDGELSATGALSHVALREAGFESLLRDLPRDVGHALASNVAGPDFGNRLARAVGIHIGGDLHFARSETKGFGIKNGYVQPRLLGVDRWVAMVGAWAEFESALCVVDAGTALTIDALDAKGRHLGGQIVPGIDLLGESLATETSDIGPAVRDFAIPRKPRDWFARATEDAVACGSLSALGGAIDRSMARLEALGLEPELVLTGGDASRILEALGGRPKLRPNLVLAGLLRMLPEEADA